MPTYAPLLRIDHDSDSYDIVQRVNAVLRSRGLEFHSVDGDDGYLIYALRPVVPSEPPGPPGPPKEGLVWDSIDAPVGWVAGLRAPARLLCGGCRTHIGCDSEFRVSARYCSHCGLKLGEVPPLLIVERLPALSAAALGGVPPCVVCHATGRQWMAVLVPGGRSSVVVCDDSSCYAIGMDRLKPECRSVAKSG